MDDIGIKSSTTPGVTETETAVKTSGPDTEMDLPDKKWKRWQNSQPTLNIDDGHDMLAHKAEALLWKSFKRAGIYLTGKLSACEGCLKAKA